MTQRRPNPFAAPLEESIKKFEPERRGVRLSPQQTRKLTTDTGYIKSENTESSQESMRALTIRLPESILNEFSLYAGKEFGHFRGCKTKFFLKLWEDYKQRHTLP